MTTTVHLLSFRLAASAAAMTLTASVAAIPVEFDFTLADGQDTIVQPSGATPGSVTDDVGTDPTGLTVGLRTGNASGFLGSFETGSGSNGSGVDNGPQTGGTATQIQSLSTSTGNEFEFVEFIAVQPTFLVSVDFSSFGTNESAIFDINGTTQTVLRTDLNAGEAFTFAPNTLLQSGEVFRITATNAGAGNAESDFRIQTLEVDIVPEPGSVALLASACAAIVMRRRR